MDDKTSVSALPQNDLAVRSQISRIRSKNRSRTFSLYVRKVPSITAESGMHVGRVSAVKFPEGQHRRFKRVALPAQKLLKRQMDVDADVDGIHCRLRMCPVAALSENPDPKMVAGGGNSPFP